MKTTVKCDFCGKSLPHKDSRPQLNFAEKARSAASKDGSVFICENCVSSMHKVLFPGGDSIIEKHEQRCSEKKVPNNVEKKNTPSLSADIPSPVEIYEHLSSKVIGQDRYLRHLSIFGYEHRKRLDLIFRQKIDERNVMAKKNLFIIGPSGTGKTMGVAALADFIGVPSLIVDSTSLTAEGYVGLDICDIVKSTIAASGNDVKRAEMAVIAIDEVDKIATKASGSLDIGGQSVQMSLLKLIESTKHSGIEVPTNKYRKGQSENISFSPRHVSFVAMGAFSGLRHLMNVDRNRIGFNKNKETLLREEIAYEIADDEDIDAGLIKFGMMPEFLARFNGGRAILNPLGLQSLKDILMNEHGFIQQEIRHFENEGIRFEITDGGATALAKMALDKKTGARALHFQFNELILDLKFRHYGGQSRVKNIRIGAGRNGSVRIAEN